MRLAGTLDNQHDAATLVDYLLTLGIHAKPERNGEQWELWILDEDRVVDAKQELKAFQFQPEDQKYRAAVKEADRLRREQVDKVLEARRNVIRLPRSRGSVGGGPRPLTMLLLVACSVVFVMSDFGTKHTIDGKLQVTEVRRFNDGGGAYAPGLPEIRRGEFWRIFSPMLLHFSIMHFVFNMYWLVEFGSQIETRRGTLILALLVLTTSAACNLGQYAWSGPNFGGMSGVNYGLFGYLLIKSKYEPWTGFVLHPTTVFLMIGFFFLCMTPYIANVANAGHAGGLAAGALFAAVPILLRRSR
jgi:GlpG protein